LKLTHVLDLWRELGAWPATKKQYDRLITDGPLAALTFKDRHKAGRESS
jgi:hypothetical protein